MTKTQVQSESGSKSNLAEDSGSDGVYVESFDEKSDLLEKLSLIAKEWLEADKRNLSQLRYIQEDRLCCCLRSLGSEESAVVERCFAQTLAS